MTRTELADSLLPALKHERWCARRKKGDPCMCIVGDTVDRMVELLLEYPNYRDQLDLMSIAGEAIRD